MTTKNEITKMRERADELRREALELDMLGKHGLANVRRNDGRALIAQADEAEAAIEARPVALPAVMARSGRVVHINRFPADHEHKGALCGRKAPRGRVNRMAGGWCKTQTYIGDPDLCDGCRSIHEAH